MDTLVALVNSLSKAEKKYLKTLLEAFNGRANENKMLDTVVLIEKNEKITHNELAQLLYKDPKSKAFLVMKKRLTERIHEVILNVENIPNNQTIENDPIAFEYAHYIKQFSIAMNLLKRGLKSQAKNHLEDECLHHPQAEYYLNFKLIVWEYYRNIVAVQLSIEEYDNLSAQIREIEKQNDLVRKAQEMFDRTLMLSTMKNLNSSLLDAELERMTDILSNELISSYNVKAHYYYLYLQLISFQRKRNYPQMESTAKQMLDLSSQHKHLYDNQRMGFIIAQIQNLAFRQCQFLQVYEYAQRSIDLSHSKKKNQAVLYFHKALACFYMGKWEETAEIYNYSQTNFVAENSDPMLYYVYPNMFASMAYLKQNFRETRQWLSQAEAASNSKDNINSNLKI
ncbi:MAG: hypothetical protein ACKVTZ_13240, partial [Bacteroidia bacterium]